MGSQLWWHGPEWLNTDREKWPIERFIARREEEEAVEREEEAVEAAALVKSTSTNEFSFIISIEKFSSLYKLQRVVSWVLRFITLCRSQAKPPQPALLTVQELKRAEIYCIKFIQQKHFSCIMKHMKQGHFSGQPTSLQLFIDDEGVLRCHGRFENSVLPFSCNNPILLPSNEYYTELVIYDVHVKLDHAGVQHTLSQIRRRFWIQKGRAFVQKVLNKCTLCRLHESKPLASPIFPPLPYERITRSLPFTYSGVDYAGPRYMQEFRNGEKVSVKRWICLFV
ncbi:MAG: hypothetical protein GY816_13200, partial [Cytophagales bacterium]|nr:hypothetical protein [Cytophagales bacterium]